MTSEVFVKYTVPTLLFLSVLIVSFLHSDDTKGCKHQVWQLIYIEAQLQKNIIFVLADYFPD